MIADRWEVGSAFHWTAAASPSGLSSPPWQRGVWLGTGRQALRLVVDLGRSTRGWKRLWVPSYFCQEVVAALVATGLPLAVYRDRPGEPIEPPETRAGDALLVHSGFGLRTRRPKVPVDVIEDHTHSLLSRWCRRSDATFCIASLRKLFPVADGAVAWSPEGLALPDAPEETETHRKATDRRLQGMLLKALYLDGWAVDKPTYRRLLDAGEAAFAGDAEPCAASPLTRALVPTLPLERLEQAHRDNHARLCAALEGESRCRVLRAGASAAPFCAFVVFDDADTRDHVRSALIERQVYASALWPLDSPAVEGIPEDDLALSARSFCLPVDFRYEAADMDRVGDILRGIG